MARSQEAGGEDSGSDTDRSVSAQPVETSHDGGEQQQQQQQQQPDDPTSRDDASGEEQDGSGSEEEEDSEDEEEDEPRLKYAPLTKNLSSLYRNGDATSSFLTGGDKMVVGTHNGNIHVLSLPAFQTIRTYHAHSATVTAISTSPFPPPLPSAKFDYTSRLSAQTEARSPSPSPRADPSRSSRQTGIPNTPSNAIYIATASLDGNVCVSSLIDPKDVLLRNFGRPVQAVALSPDYKNDRNYLSGGLAGQLILTTGGRIGTSSNATTTGTAAVASGWLGSIGLGANTGKDTVLHSGEGTINTIKWSLSGKYIVWVNEQGIKIMRSNLHLESADSDYAWKRMCHIDRPNRTGWEEMAGVWKARAEWVDESALESETNSALDIADLHPNSGANLEETKKALQTQQVEKLVVGWGGSIWIINVFPGSTGSGKDVGEKSIGKVDYTILRTDCIISGVSLYTPNLLLVLAYVQHDDETEAENPDDTPRKGVRHRHNALEPELRLIDVTTKEEVSADTLTVSRFGTLSASDYHLGVLPALQIPLSVSQKGALETIGASLWDASLYPARIFSSGASIRSSKGPGDRALSSKASSGSLSVATSSATIGRTKELQSIAATQGMKIFIHSPYDCVIAVKRSLADRVAWLVEHTRYPEAWALVDEHPEAVNAAPEETPETIPGTPTKAGSLAEFFADSSSQSTVAGVGAQAINSAAEKEKRRIGELWLEQLISEDNWAEAGEIANKVLGTSARWEHWIWKFIQNKKFDEITPFIPTSISIPLPSMIYEVVLGHYAPRDRRRLKELLDAWPLDMFDTSSVITTIEDQIRLRDVQKGSDDWILLEECLAKLFLASSRERDALHCYIQLQDADTALSLIKEFNLLDSISDDIPALVTLRVTPKQAREASVSDLESLTADSISLLVNEAHNGLVAPETVVSQLSKSDKYRLYLFFYLRALWNGEGVKLNLEAPDIRGRSHLRAAAAAANLAKDEGHALVDRFADEALELFADYDRNLFMEFLQASTSYSYERANAVCEQRHYTPELIYLLSKTGQTKRALGLIISDLDDVTRAIEFAKEQDDVDLWEDLMNYSMDKPRFIQGLLTEAGTAVDPIKLIRKIPSGLEVEGLREGLMRLIREYDIQDSISRGVAKVLEGEVSVGMEQLRRGQRRGVKVNVVNARRPKANLTSVPVEKEDEEPKAEKKKAGEEKDKEKDGEEEKADKPVKIKPRFDVVYADDDKESLVAFACGHIYPLSYLTESTPPLSSPAQSTFSKPNRPGTTTSYTSFTPYDEDSYFDNGASYTGNGGHSVGQKVLNARLIREKLSGSGKGGCRLCGLVKVGDGGDKEA